MAPSLTMAYPNTHSWFSQGKNVTQCAAVTTKSRSSKTPEQLASEGCERNGSESQRSKTSLSVSVPKTSEPVAVDVTERGGMSAAVPESARLRSSTSSTA